MLENLAYSNISATNIWKNNNKQAVYHINDIVIKTATVLNFIRNDFYNLISIKLLFCLTGDHAKKCTLFQF